MEYFVNRNYLVDPGFISTLSEQKRGKLKKKIFEQKQAAELYMQMLRQT
jgi:hypothetical protein